MKFIVVDRGAAEVIVTDRLLQSTDFEQGRDLVQFLKGDLELIASNPRLGFARGNGGSYILTISQKREDLIVFDLTSCDLFFKRSDEDFLFLFQRVLRFGVKYWSGETLAPYERIITGSTKAVVFPYPIKSQTEFRISIEKHPDAKRTGKRGAQSYLLVYKCGTSAGEGANEEAEVTQFRKAISSLSGARNELASAEKVPTDSGINQLYVADLEGETHGHDVSPFSGYDSCMSFLSKVQRDFVTHDLHAPYRIEGPAGTGKTISLVLKCIYHLKAAQEAKIFYKSAFITHSDATRENIELLFRANDGVTFIDVDSYSAKQSVEITTLHRLCSKLLNTNIRESEFLDRDALESKNTQMLYVDDALSDSLDCDLKTYKEFISKELLMFFTSEDRWGIAELIQHEISVVIKGRAEEDIDKYKKIERTTYGVPLKTEADRIFIYSIFQKYQNKLKASAVFDTDDVVLSAMGQINTPIWRRRRKSEGFDTLFIDETHLFNMNELSVFHHLMKSEGPFPIAYSVDKSQAIGDRGWERASISKYLVPASETSEEETRVNTIFRCSSEIVNLALSVTSSGASLFTNFENPLASARSAFTALEDRKCARPLMRFYPNDEAMVEGAFERAECLRKTMKVTRGDILIVTFDQQCLSDLKRSAKERNKPIELLERRGDGKIAARARTSGRFVVGHADFVGGLEFDGVVLVGVDEGRVPPFRGVEGTESSTFLKYMAHNRLYVAITRAKYRVEILGVDARGASPLLQSALNSKVLETT